jgi:hypothetical protein
VLLAQPTTSPNDGHHSPGVLGKSSPATSESGNRCQQQQLSGSEDAPHAQSNPAIEDEAKRLIRMQRNRENAHLSRQRKKQQMSELEQQCSQLRNQNTHLAGFMHRMIAENCLLRRHLMETCAKANVPVPIVPSAAATPAVFAAMQQARPVQPVSMLPFGAGPMPRMPPAASQNGLPQAALIPAPATATTAPHPAAPAPAAPSGRQPRKRSRTVTGASAALVTLLSLFMFVGPFVPQTGHALPGSTSLSALPAAANAPWLQHGRSLQALPDAHHTGLVPLVGIDGAPSEAYSLAPLALAMNHTMETLLADPETQKTEAAALERLQELAPVAMLLDKLPVDGQPSTGSSVLAASHAFPLLAGSLFKESGLQVPQTCTKVFEFDAAAMPQTSRTRRSVEKFLMQSHGFKGRSLVGDGAAAVPAVPRSPPLPVIQAGERQRPVIEAGPLAALDASPLGHHVVGEEESEGVLVPVELSQEPLLVSVLLPANDSQSGDGGMSVVDKVFVVLLNPQNKYVTYSCGLAKPLLV